MRRFHPLLCLLPLLQPLLLLLPCTQTLPLLPPTCNRVNKQRTAQCAHTGSILQLFSRRMGCMGPLPAAHFLGLCGGRLFSHSSGRSYQSDRFMRLRARLGGNASSASSMRSRQYSTAGSLRAHTAGGGTSPLFLYVRCAA